MARNWGWVVFAVVIVGWLTSGLGAGALVVLSVLSAVYFFFRAPAWCGASGWGGACRNSSKGALMGCHLSQHKWQKVRMLATRARWGRLVRELCPNGTTALATVGGVLAVLSGIAAALRPLWDNGG
ncbi:hypothetical protein AB0C96_24120 [Streptomyces sp. NPDC048506]|uniref:hypothetical protein n=1 Tax=Streptomyces sp. NPDC048506 TaxID=3155028 RepID=UPI0034348D6C